MAERISFYNEIQSNKLKSFVLMAIIVVFFVMLGYFVSVFFDPSYFFVIMIFSIIISLTYTLVSYYNSDKIALASVNAKPASRTEHRIFFDAVESMSLASGLPMPRLYVMNSSEINAFASGRDPKHAVICVTSGTLAKLTRQELEGVIAHEMSHVANYDIRFMTLATVMIGMISIAAEMFLRSLWFSGHDDRDSKAGAFIIIFGILFAILAPLAAQLVQLAISRKREFLADSTAVKLTRSPTGLINALKKIRDEHVPREETKRYSKATAPLFIADPFKKASNLFQTHPELNERIKRLERM